MAKPRKWRKNFYMPGVDSRWWMDMAKRITCRPVPAFPRMVQIQTHTACNAACVFCPHPKASKLLPQGRMDEALFRKIVEEIEVQNATLRISPYLMNEPFLDPAILEKARFIKQRVPRASVVLTTNGSLLSKDIVDDLVKNNPLRALYISMQGIEKDAYEASMGGGLVFENTKENIEYLIDARNQCAPNLKIVVTMVKTNRINAEKAVAYWKSRGIDSKFTRLENRGGNTAAFDDLNAGGRRIYRDCVRMLKNAYILYNGDIILCCTDYYRTKVLGNITDSNISVVWNSEEARELRRSFLRGELESLPRCADCMISTNCKT